MKRGLVAIRKNWAMPIHVNAMYTFQRWVDRYVIVDTNVEVLMLEEVRASAVHALRSRGQWRDLSLCDMGCHRIGEMSSTNGTAHCIYCGPPMIPLV